jgi:hypothetical protein
MTNIVKETCEKVFEEILENINKTRIDLEDIRNSGGDIGSIVFDRNATSPENGIKNELTSIINEYSNKISGNENDDAENENDGSGSTASIHALFKFVIYGLGCVLTYILYVYKRAKMLTITDFLGSSIMVFGFAYLLTKSIDMSTDKYSESDGVVLLDKMLMHVKKFTDDRSVDNTHLIKFLNLYLTYNSNDENTKVYSKLEVDNYMKKMNTFFLKSENIGIGNKNLKDKLKLFYDLVVGEKINSKALVYKYGVDVHADAKVRENIIEEMRLLNLYDTFNNLKKQIEEGTSVLRTTDGQMDTRQYPYYFDREDGSSSIIEQLMSDLTNHLTNKIDSTSSDDDYSTIFETIVKINNCLHMLKLVNLPEYYALSRSVLFFNQPELNGMLDIDQRYRIADERKTLSTLNANLFNFEKNEVTKTAFDSLPVQLKKTNTSEATVTEKTTILLGVYKNIIYRYKDDSIAKMEYLKRVMKFTTHTRTYNITKFDFDNSYKQDVTVLQKIIQKMFRHSNVKKVDIISYVKHNIKKDESIDKKEKLLLSTNMQKYVDIIFDNIQDIDSNLALVKNTTDNITNNKEYVSFDQFSAKMDAYDKPFINALKEHTKNIKVEIDNIIMRDNFQLYNQKDKASLFKDMTYIGIISSIFFVVGKVLKIIEKHMDVKDMSEIYDNNALKLLEIGQNVNNKSVQNAMANVKSTAQKAMTNVNNKSVQNAMANVKSSAQKAMTNVKSTAQKGREKKNELDKAVNANINRLAEQGTNAKANIKEAAENAKEKLSTLVSSKAQAGGTLLTPEALSLSDEFAYDVMKIIIIISLWVLVIMVLLTYVIKTESDMEFQIMVKKTNTVNLKNGVRELEEKLDKLFQNNNQGERDDILKEVYDKIINMLNLNKKCTVANMKQSSVVFPMTEVFVSVIMIGVCGSIIMSNNMLYNPFEVWNKFEKLQKVVSYSKEAKEESKEEINIVVNGHIREVLISRIARLDKLAILFGEATEIASESDQFRTQFAEKKRFYNTMKKQYENELSNFSDANDYVDITNDEKNMGNIKPILRTRLDTYRKRVKEYQNVTTNLVIPNKKDINIMTIDMENMEGDVNDIDFIIQQYGTVQRNPLGVKGGGESPETNNVHTGGGEVQPKSSPNRAKDVSITSNIQNKIEDEQKYESILNELKTLDNIIVSDNNHILYISFSFALSSVAIYMSYSVFNNALKYKWELFNGYSFTSGNAC